MKASAVFIGVVGLLSAGMVQAAQAHAGPEEDYIASLESQGVHGNRDALITVGNQVCAAQHGDMGAQAALGFTIYSTGVSLGDLNTRVFPTATHFLCPEVQTPPWERPKS